jgi:uncharacterized protein YigE (DUF2233 family)
MRSAWRWMILGALLAFAAFVAAAGGPRGAADLALANLERIERMGRLEILSTNGWEEVPTSFETRLAWDGTDDAFLVPAIKWQELAPGFVLGEIDLRRAPNPQIVSVVVTRIDPARWSLRVLAGDGFPPMGITDLARAGGAPFAVNGPFFSEHGPLGLIVVDGQQRHSASSAWTSHFLVDGPGKPIRIAFEDPTAPVDQAFQGFPAIMKAGEAYRYMRWGGRGFDVWAVERRTAACVDRNGWVDFLVTRTLTNGLAFHELTTLLGGLGCVDAMGFDGGTSTGLFLDVGGVHDEIANLKPVPVALGAYPI